MSRVDQSIAARSMMGEDFFGGWDNDDRALFERHAVASAPQPGKITDFLGVRTTTAFHPWATHLDNMVISELPLPDDQLRAEAIEYVALLDALEKAPPARFTMAEVGSSYAPWTGAAAVCARRMDKTDVRLTAVEASSYLFGLIPQHLAENGVDPASVRIINGAAATTRTQLFFPKVSSPGDNGGQASQSDGSADYLNRTVENEAVEAYPLADLVPDGIVDLIHIDVQGHEHDILAASVDLLRSRVRNLFIGTHSRKIEGLLLDLLHGEGWQLVRERPTRFHYSRDHADVVAWTTRDGGQYWRNPALADA